MLLLFLSIFLTQSNRAVRAQDVLAVSSLQTYISVSYGDVQLAGEDTQATATVLVVRTTGVRPSSSGGNPSTFVFNVSSLPPNGGTNAQPNSNVQCTAPDPVTNQCGATQRVEVQITSEPPVRRFQLREIPMIEIPFAYYFSLVDGDCSTEDCYTQRKNTYRCQTSNDCCEYQGTSVSQSQTSSIKTTPTAKLISQAFLDSRNGPQPRRPGQPIGCPTRYGNIDDYTAPNGNVTNPGSTALQYNFICGKKPVQFYAAFYQLAPMCRVYRLEQGEVVGRIYVTVRDIDSGVVRTVTVDTAQYETAGVTAEGDLLVRVLNVQSASDTLVQSLPGALLVCGNDVPIDEENPEVLQIPTLDMFPKPDNPTEKVDILKNPWLELPLAERGYTYPTPQMINKVRKSDKPAPNQFYYFMNFDEALSIGKQKCGQLGITPDYYKFMTNEVQFSLYEAQVGQKVKVSYEKIRSLDEIHTCVPEFGLGYRNRLNITTPCAAVATFHNNNQGDYDQRKFKYDTMTKEEQQRHLIRGTSVVEPNVAINNDFLYLYDQLDAQWEVSIAMKATLLGVKSRPFSGSIDRTSYTSCVLEPDNPNRVGVLSAYVCSGVPQDFVQEATYVVYAECAPTSGLVVVVPVEKSTKSLPYGKCELISFDLRAGSTFTPEGSLKECSLYLGSSGAQTASFVVGGSLTLDTVRVFCDNSNIPANYTSASLLKNTSDIYILSNASIVSRKEYAAPPPPETDTSWYIWGLIGLVSGIAGLMIIGLLLFIWACFKTNTPTKVNVVDD